MYYNQSDFADLNNIFRLNLINSITGIKPANLIATKSSDEQSNVAIFSSVVHLGSHPALIGFVMRPTENGVARNTWDNIQDTGFYTINHINRNMIERAHYTSIKFSKDISEFEKCQLKEEYLFDFSAPFVGDSDVKIGMSFRQAIPITLNDTVLVIGEVQHISLPDSMIDNLGQTNYSEVDGIGVSGLNRYYDLQLVAEHPYARPEELPDFPTS